MLSVTRGSNLIDGRTADLRITSASSENLLRSNFLVEEPARLFFAKLPTIFHAIFHPPIQVNARECVFA